VGHGRIVRSTGALHPHEPDGSNAAEMVQWVTELDKEAQRIAERFILFMHDLTYHQDAESDTLAASSLVMTWCQSTLSLDVPDQLSE